MPEGMPYEEAVGFQARNPEAMINEIDLIESEGFDPALQGTVIYERHEIVRALRALPAKAPKE